MQRPAVPAVPAYFFPQAPRSVRSIRPPAPPAPPDPPASAPADPAPADPETPAPDPLQLRLRDVCRAIHMLNFDQVEHLKANAFADPQRRAAVARSFDACDGVYFNYFKIHTSRQRFVRPENAVVVSVGTWQGNPRIFVTVDFQDTGEHILSSPSENSYPAPENRPRVLATPSPDLRECAACGNRLAAQLCCCGAAVYCDDACQRADKAAHRDLCRAVRRGPAPVVFVYPRVFVRRDAIVAP